MVTLALALVTFSDKSKDVFYEFYFAVFSLLLFKRKGKKEKKQTNKQQNKTESEQTRPPVQVWDFGRKEKN